MSAVARVTDPETSHRAASSVNLTRGQKIVLELFQIRNHMTDSELIDFNRREAMCDQSRRLSESGARSRRAELTAGGLIVDSGIRKLTENGRQSIVWKLVTKGE